MGCTSFLKEKEERLKIYVKKERLPHCVVASFVKGACLLG